MQLKITNHLDGCHAQVLHEDKTWDLGYITDSELSDKLRQRLHGDVWMWRNPHCHPRDLRDLLLALEHAQGEFSVRLRSNSNEQDFYAIVAVNNEQVARWLSWKTMQRWQQWSRQEESKHLRDQRNTTAPEISADGKTMRVKVKVSTLGD